jgi:hypothetical protein
LPVNVDGIADGNEGIAADGFAAPEAVEGSPRGEGGGTPGFGSFVPAFVASSLIYNLQACLRCFQ